MKKRVLSFALMLSLCAALCTGFEAFAATTPEFQNPAIETSVYCGKDGSCAYVLKSNGELWGYVYGSGDGEYENKLHAKLLLSNVVAVASTSNAVSSQVALALKTDGTLWKCYVSYIPYASFDAVLLETNVVAIDSSLSYLKANGDLYNCFWTMDNSGSISFDKKFVAGNVISFLNAKVYITSDYILHYDNSGLEKTMPGFRKLMAFYSAESSNRGVTFFALSQNGDLYGWNENKYGNVGCGPTDNYNWPFGYQPIYNEYNYPSVTVYDPQYVMSDVTNMYFDDDCIYARKTDGSLWQWGDSPTPAKVKLGNTINEVLESLKWDDNKYLSPRRSSSNEVTYKTVRDIIIKSDGTLYMRYEKGDDILEILLPVKFSELMSSTASVPTPPIAEVPSSWATEAVNAAIAAELVPTALQSKYTQATTRAEFCALAVALYQSVTNSDLPILSSFSDTTDENVLKMATLGVVNGVGDNKFAPNDKLTREQAATMLSRLANAIGKPLTEQAATFSDNGSVSSWAADAVGQMQSTGIMGGVGNNTFAPKSDYTREQSIITMMRLFDIVK